ncbi:MAG: polysaccharide export protein [Gammaproteobacteria bacterium]|nr:polysaccharide export protein [Gammaproteobacteria bacterium]
MMQKTNEWMTGKNLRVPLFALLAILTACRSIPLPESTTQVESATTVPDWGVFKLGPGDRLYLSVYGQPDFTTPDIGVRVSPTGHLSVPLLGAVPVEGKTAEDVRLAIESGLKTFLVEPAVTVWVSEYSSRRFHLLGEVEQPGPYVMDRPITALEALSLGKGVKPGGNRDQVVILRRHGEEDIEVIPFNVKVPGPDGLVQIWPEDIVFVSKSGVGRFSEQFLPYLQGIGYTLSQATSLTLVVERL